MQNARYIHRFFNQFCKVLVCLLMGGADADAARRGGREFKVHGKLARA